MTINERQCRRYTTIAAYLKEGKRTLKSVLESGKDIEMLASEAAEYKNRERAKEQIKRKPKVEKERDPDVVTFSEKQERVEKQKEKQKEDNNYVDIRLSYMTPDDAATALGIPGCIKPDKEVLKAIYRFLSNKHHPDKSGDTDSMVQINKAYEALKCA